MKKRKITMLFLIAGLLFSGCGKSDASDATDISSVKSGNKGIESLHHYHPLDLHPLTRVRVAIRAMHRIKAVIAMTAVMQEIHRIKAVVAMTAVIRAMHRIKAVTVMIAIIRAIHPVKVRMETAAVAVHPTQKEVIMTLVECRQCKTEAAVRDRCHQEDRAMHQETHRMPMACKISKIAPPIVAQDRTAAKANPLRKANRTQTAKRRV